MKFSQKLVCIMLLVIAAFFAVGGAVLVNGSFMDRLTAAKIPTGMILSPPPPGAQGIWPVGFIPRGCSAHPLTPPRTKPMPYTACRTAKAFCSTAPM